MLTRRSLAAVTALTGAGLAAPAFAVPGAPPHRASHGMAYDSARRQLILFGGVDGAFERLGDTWAWDGAVWRQLAGPGPSPRVNPQMAYDPVRRQIVLFGGSDGAVSGETWLLDEAGWRSVVNTGPAGRQLGAMAFDEIRGHAVLFGGADSTRRKLGDTWAWDGAQWTLLAEAGPTPRTSHGLIWHPGLGRMIVLGGNGAAALGDSWAWDGATWTPFAPDGPPMFHFATGYDADRRALIVFGGFGEGGRVGDTWLVTEAGWRRQPVESGPPLRAEHDGAVVPGVGFVVFGGIGGQGMGEAERAAALLNDTWVWRAGRWSRLV